MSYRPEQRQVASQVMTTAGWLQGILHVPRAGKLVPHLNSQHGFLRATTVSFMGKPHQVPFMSLQRNKVILVVPSPEEESLVPELEGLDRKRVFVLLPGGVLSGTLMLHQGVRTSDFFSKQQGFVLLEDCVLQLGSLNSDFFVEERHPAVIINAPQIIAVSESDPLASTTLGSNET